MQKNMGNDDIIIPFSYGASNALPVPQRSDRADLIDKIKPEGVVELTRHRLLGEELKDGKWVAVDALKDRKLTEVGAWEIANLMLGVSTINTSVSKLKDVEIKKRALSIAKTAQYMILSNWQAYGLRNTAQMYYVHEIVFTNTLVVLKQADEASIQELLKGTVQENRNVNTERKEPGRVKRLLGMN